MHSIWNLVVSRFQPKEFYSANLFFLYIFNDSASPVELPFWYPPNAFFLRIPYNLLNLATINEKQLNINF